jgi:hypothetical protein
VISSTSSEPLSPRLFDLVLRRRDYLSSDLDSTARSDDDIGGSGMYQHLVVSYHGHDTLDGWLSVTSYGGEEQLNWATNNAAALSQTRVVDVHGRVPVESLTVFSDRVPTLAALRLYPDDGGRCMDQCPLVTRTLVIIGEPNLPRTGTACIPRTPRLLRVVIHIDTFCNTNSMWYDQLLHLHDTEEIVIVFTDWKKPYTPEAAPDACSITYPGERLQKLCDAVGDILTDRASLGGTYCEGIMCTIVDLNKVDPEWFGLPPNASIISRLIQEVHAMLRSRGWSGVEEEVLGLLHFKTESHWSEELQTECDSS